MSLRIKKNYGMLWYCHVCKCGKKHNIPLIILNMIFSFKHKYYYRCDNCGYVVCFRNLQNIVVDSTDKKMKELNSW